MAHKWYTKCGTKDLNSLEREKKKRHQIILYRNVGDLNPGIIKIVFKPIHLTRCSTITFTHFGPIQHFGPSS